MFGEGQYRPESFEGKRLLAHELTHVVQQRTGTGRRNNNDGKRSSSSNDSAGRADSAETIHRSSHQDCEECDLRNHIWPADHIARDMASRSVRDLAAFKSSPTDAHVRDLLLRNFNDDSPSTVDEVHANFVKIRMSLMMMITSMNAKTIAIQRTHMFMGPGQTSTFA